MINYSTNLDVDGIRSSLDSQVENVNARGSGFTIDRSLEFTIVITKYRPLHCVVNVRNEDEKCFYEPLHNKEHTNHYKPHLTSLKVSGIDFPMSPKQIHLFEEQNPEIAINLYAVDLGNTELAFTVEYLSTHKERQHHVNLLLLEELETGKSHYTWIRACLASYPTEPIIMVSSMYAAVAFTPSPPESLMIITSPTANPISPNK